MERLYLICKANSLKEGFIVSCKGAKKCPIRGCSSKALVVSIENGTDNYPPWKKAIFGHGTMRPILSKKQKV